ncbi:hypothetical protein Tco_0702606 [Tanacetum coccineum]|uniref:Gag-Pol polyprotein n=1 Tax=Tanacetum coccineum TaxID=301880 RepID=A0ABQ4XWH1_9ASTR
MFDEYFEVTRVDAPVPSATAVNAHVVPPGTSVTTTLAQDAPSISFSQSSSGIQPPVIQHDVAIGPTNEDTPITQATLHPSNNPVTGEPGSAQSSSGDVSIAEPNHVTQPLDHLRKWFKDHPLDNIVRNPSRLVSTRKQLASDALWCCFHSELSKLKPKNFKMAVIEDCWFQAMQDEIHEFDRLEVWKIYTPKEVCCQVNLKEFEDPIINTHLTSEEEALTAKAGTKGLSNSSKDEQRKGSQGKKLSENPPKNLLICLMSLNQNLRSAGKPLVENLSALTEAKRSSSKTKFSHSCKNLSQNLSPENLQKKTQHPILQQTTPIPTTTTTPPIITEALAIILEIPEITSFIALQLRVAKLEQDMSQVKKIDHSAAVLASIQSQVPPVVDKVSRTKLDDATFPKKQESEKSQEEIIRIKKEQEEKNQEPTYTIKSSDQAALEEFDLKSALFKSMHKNKSANRNSANYRLYHALIKALIEDENAIDKEVADTVRDHKRKHDDDDDDDDDEGPLAGSNQGKSTKRRRTRESESTKKHPPLNNPPSIKIQMWVLKLVRHVSDPEDTDNAHMPKILDTTTWFRLILEKERPASLKLEWVIPPIDLPKADNNWANAFAKAHQIPDENKPS